MENNQDWIKLGFTDIDGLFRGKIIHRSKFEKSKDLSYCDVVFGWDLHDVVYPQDSLSGWQGGFPDAMASVDLDTERVIPWDNMPLYIIDFSNDDKFKHACPRSLLSGILDEYEEAGLEVNVGFEYEWYNFKLNEDTISKPEDHSITDGMFGYSLLRLEQNHELVHDFLNKLDRLGIILEGFHTETGPGVFEAAIRYDEALKAADKAILFKHFTKSIFRQHGMMASFMAKWNQELPGCGGHIHISIKNKSGDYLGFTNMAEDPVSSSFLAGLIDYMPSLTSVYAPFINSYKRLVPGSWAPVSASWGIQNRTAPVRIIPGQEGNDRLEFRLPGSDANPYLALYACLASGLHGMKTGLKLKQDTPVSNAYEKEGHPVLPDSLREAIQKTKSKEQLKSFMNGTFLEHYLMTRSVEVAQYARSVTDWERKRYLEIL